MSKRRVWLLQRGQKKKMNEASVQAVSYSLHKREALSSSNLPKLTVGCLTRYWMAFSYWKKHSDTLDCWEKLFRLNAWVAFMQVQLKTCSTRWAAAEQRRVSNVSPRNLGAAATCLNAMDRMRSHTFYGLITRWDVWSIFDPLATG